MSSSHIFSSDPLSHPPPPPPSPPEQSLSAPPDSPPFDRKPLPGAGVDSAMSKVVQTETETAELLLRVPDVTKPQEEQPAQQCERETVPKGGEKEPQPQAAQAQAQPQPQQTAAEQPREQVASDAKEKTAGSAQKEEHHGILYWLRQVNWLNVTLIIGMPMYGFIQAWSVPLLPKTAAFAFLYYVLTGVSITAGYHRLWAHRAYKASYPLQVFLAAFGAGAVEGSIRWWARDHRAHHRYTDTTKDPYSVQKGLFYSHIGWMVIKQDPKRIGRTDISDFNEDPLIMWQHRNYLKSVITMGLAVPMLVTGLGWGDWWGGFVYAGLIRIFVVQQATFCVNSLAHWLGDQPFDDRNSPRDHFITALATFGEGYHNFHHEFPSDYRNAIQWFQYDPTKWLIRLWCALGLAYELKTFRSNEIEMGRVQQLLKKIDRTSSKLDWGVPIETLPIITWNQYVEEAKTKRPLVAISGIVHDVSQFIDEHPGGKAMIGMGIGKDATAMFNGGVYRHSNAAHNILGSMRVAVILGGTEVEVWKERQELHRRQREEHPALPFVSAETNNDCFSRAGMQITNLPNFSAPMN